MVKTERKKSLAMNSRHGIGKKAETLSQKTREGYNDKIIRSQENCKM